MNDGAALIHQACARVSQAPGDGDALGYLGACVSQTGNIDTAFKLFDRARRAAPDNAQSHFAFGGAAQALGDTPLAEHAFTDAALCLWRARGQPSAAKVAQPYISLGWQSNETSGWGVYAKNFLDRVAARGDWTGLVLDPIIALDLPNDPNAALYRQSLAAIAPDLLAGRAVEFPLLVALGNDFGRFPHIGRSRREIGIMFIEHTELSSAGRDDAARYELIVAGSSWCADVVRGMGFNNVATVIQGINPALFNPAIRPARTKPFRIFSGGKIEYRKGQDIVAETFRRFHARRPDSQLVICWHSAVPQAAASVTWGGIIDRPPDIGADGRLDLMRWLTALGIPAGAIEDLGVVANSRLPGILSTVHAAIFPNRCEGGTNLPAMEAMAAGVPCVLSANTGHLDLIEPGNSMPLTRQMPVFPDQIPGTEGWGESDIDEAVEALDHLYLDHVRAEAIGAKGAETLAKLTWAGQIDRLLSLIGPV